MSSPSHIHLAWPTTTAIRGERPSSPALSTAMLPRRVAPANSKIEFIGSPSISTARKIRFPRSGINQYPLHRLAFHRLHTPVSSRDSSTRRLTFAARIPRPLAFPFPRTNREDPRINTGAHMLSTFLPSPRHQPFRVDPIQHSSTGQTAASSQVADPWPPTQ
ncbi:hypothetical protein K456DRAFT_57868 [Colletotrichum gloeosporioides 23]|nr:hypothetical protein K456DRAFT_57868 [Colletotrichum gloeosporioides 23]